MGQKIKQAYGKQCAGVHFDINLCFPDVLYAAKNSRAGQMTLFPVSAKLI